VLPEDFLENQPVVEGLVIQEAAAGPARLLETIGEPAEKSI
jgi:hypothetical protein